MGRAPTLLAQEIRVANNSHVGIISGLGSGTSNFFLDVLGSTPVFSLGEIMGPALGNKM